jgi:hypothetical protein
MIREQTAAAYAGNGPRLLAIKKKFDPENTFFVRHPLST